VNKWGSELRALAARIALALAFSVVLVAALAASLLATPAEPAFADEDNSINTTQIPDNSFLFDVSLYDLVMVDTTLEGKTVQVTGEVVGDTFREGLTNDTKTWILLSSTEEDKEASIPVLINTEDLDLIDSFGGYQNTGTTLRIRGTYHVACVTHGSACDIHADLVSAVSEGSSHKEEFDLKVFAPGAGLCVVGFGLWITYLVLRERRR